jgi:uncharacterized protein
LAVNVAELMRRAGNDKDIVLPTTLEALGVDDERFDPAASANVSLHLESLTDGLVVRGEVTAPWRSVCRRCLEAAAGVTVSVVDELYQLDVTDPDAYPLEGDVLDLAPMVRETIVLDAPLAPLCRVDCQGICPQCGVDRNRIACDCDTAASDPRWAGLDVLKAQLDEDSTAG